MYEGLAKSLRTTVMLYGAVGQEDLVTTQLMKQAADAIEERDRYALTIQHEMMAEAESHIALVERLNKQIEELQKQVAYWQAQLAKSMCGETLAELEKPRWIPVTERLPSPMRAVLVWTPYKHNVFMAYLQGNKWYVWGPDDICCHNWPEYHAITHWMYLPPEPEPPKEENKSGN